MQSALRDSLRNDLIAKNPDWNHATLNRMLNRMVAPVGDPSPPPHATGAALDVAVLNTRGEQIDFSSPFDFWIGAPTYCSGLSDQAKQNRIMLIKALEGVGLTNYVGEWWHWSYGDQGWALRTGAHRANYGLKELENAEALRIPNESTPTK